MEGQAPAASLPFAAKVVLVGFWPLVGGAVLALALGRTGIGVLPAWVYGVTAAAVAAAATTRLGAAGWFVCSVGWSRWVGSWVAAAFVTLLATCATGAVVFMLALALGAGPREGAEPWREALGFALFWGLSFGVGLGVGAVAAFVLVPVSLPLLWVVRQRACAAEPPMGS